MSTLCRSSSTPGVAALLLGVHCVTTTIEKLMDMHRYGFAVINLSLWERKS